MNRNAGFTLLEVLLALALGSLVMASIYGVFSTTSEASRQLEKQSNSLHLGRVLIARLDRELLGLALINNGETVLAGGTDALGEPYLELLTNSSGTPGAGYKRVRYRLGNDEQGVSVLWRSEQGRFDIEEAQEERLATGIEELKFAFYDGSWKEVWSESQNRLPLLVRAEFKLADAGLDAPLIGVFNLPQAKRVP